ncbi:hypothetical protein ACQPXT_13815 [Streptomyces sp. CA-100214]
MPAPVKGSSAGPVAEAVVAASWRRAESSEDAARFLELIEAYVTSEVDGRRRLPEPPRLDEDTVRTAAHIEALAGLRRLRARFHGPSCFCDGCRTSNAVSAHRMTREDSDE